MSSSNQQPRTTTVLLGAHQAAAWLTKKKNPESPRKVYLQGKSKGALRSLLRGTRRCCPVKAKMALTSRLSAKARLHRQRVCLGSRKKGGKERVVDVPQISIAGRAPQRAPSERDLSNSVTQTETHCHFSHTHVKKKMEAGRKRRRRQGMTGNTNRW